MAKKKDGRTSDALRVHEPHGEAELAAGNRKWRVVVVGLAKRECRDLLSPVQYDHVIDLLKRLVDWGDREELSDLDIRPIEWFYELRDKGGVLQKIDLRVYFATIPEDMEVVVLKTHKNEDENHTKRHIILCVDNRVGEYLSGKYSEQPNLQGETWARSPSERL